MDNKTAWSCLPVYQQKPNCQPKERSLGIKCVSLLDMNFDSFSSARLYLKWMLCLHIVMKRIYNFPKKSELTDKVHTCREKINWLFFCGFWGGNKKKIAEIRSEQAHFLVSQLHCSISPTVVLQHEPACRLTIMPPHIPGQMMSFTPKVATVFVSGFKMRGYRWIKT